MKKRLFVICILLLIAAVAADAAVIKVKVSIANVRSKPDLAAAVVSRVSQGAMFEVVRKVGTWYEVSVADSAGKLVPGFLNADSVEEIGGAAAPARSSAPAARPAATRAGAAGMRFDFSLGGGLGNINGDDYNAWVRDTNAYYKDLDEAYAGETAFSDKFSSDWPEMKWLMNLKGDLIYRFNPRFGVGLGFEFLSKSNSGVLNEVFKDANYRVNDSATTYYLETGTWDYTSELRDSLRVIPITLSGYAFLPVGRAGEVFGFAGIGYYMGKLKLEETYTETYDDVDLYYTNNGVQTNTRKNQGQYVDVFTQDLSGNGIGFHFGGGFSYSITPMIQVFGEALYRIASLKNWTGSVTDDWTDDYYYGYQTTGYNDYSESGAEQFTGTLYRFTYSSATMGKEYTRIGSYEGTPEETDTRTNFVKAVINLNGIALRFGIRISFGQR